MNIEDLVHILQSILTCMKKILYYRNGNSIDGVLRKLYTYDFEKGGIILIGVLHRVDFKL